MPVDDRDDAPAGASPEKEEKTVSEALQSETDEPLPPAAERIAERDADRPEPVTPQGQRRRYLTRRNAFIATIAVAVGIFAIIFIAMLIYRLGYVDRYVANQIVNTLAQYGIRAEIREFHLAFSPRTVEMLGLELYDQQTGTKLGTVDRLLATIRIEDLYALNLRRNVNLESLEVEGLEAWVTFDEQGRSNFRHIHLPPPDPNRRILFSYSTAHVKVSNSVVHYGDERYDIKGEARNIAITIQPDGPSAPAESWMNTVTFSASDSTFVYDGRPVNNIDIEARGRVDQTRAEIHELVLRSPLAEARLQGVMDDWRNLHYRMQITSSVDLTQASDILQAGASLRGVGNFTGNVSGEGTRYQVDGQISSDALAADGVRLRALSVNLRGSGEDQRYEANARAVAELLTAGDFQLNTVQLVGDVMGTGTDFRWLGELRAAAARYGSNSIAGLILSDVTAESRAGTLTASASRANINRLNAPGASVSGAQISDIRVRSENGVTTASLASVQAGTIEASGARINGVTASGVNLVDKDHLTTVETNQLRVGGISVEGAQVGSLNIAGVRLAIRDGRIQGSTADINAGTLTLANGRIEDVRINRPVFTVEPSGSYRASADLSLGGGILGQVNLGSARANLVATNNQIQLNNFNADVLNGRATGSAVLSTTPRGTSRVSADFSDLDVGGLLATLSQNVVALTGQATGRIDLTFPGTRFEAASGQINAQIRGETGDEARGRTHITGDLALRADRGLFGIERAELRAGSSEVRATGQFSFEGDSNVQLDLASANATELQRVIVASGIVPGLEDRLEDYGLELAGNLNFNGTIRGRLSDPLIDGRLALDSLKVNGRDLGTLNASLDSTPAEIRVTEGRLTEKDGGGLLLTATIPREGENNIAFNATFDRFSGDKLMAVLPENLRAGLGDMRSDLSGSINVTGFPGAMNGSGDLRFGQGSIAGQPFQEIIARAAFDGSTISLEELTAQLPTGRLTASGSYTTTSNAFNLQAQAKDLPIALIESFIGGARRLPQLTGQVDLTASASGTLTEPSTYQIALEGQGRDVTINGRPAGVLTLVGRTDGQQFNL
ncbi:MAG TPA: YdbH domain-containing protein, partial [Pyrinomonadaceae bacterium]|nr:YdbH domain-containing protein [Pyrinomonadaceae bacterium]